MTLVSLTASQLLDLAGEAHLVIFTFPPDRVQVWFTDDQHAELARAILAIPREIVDERLRRMPSEEELLRLRAIKHRRIASESEDD